MKKKPDTQREGIYSETFKSKESRLPDDPPLTDLKAEIELINLMNSRFHESLKSVTQSLDPETQLSALQAITLSAQAISLSAQAITSLICLQNLCAMDENMKYISSIPNDKMDD